MKERGFTLIEIVVVIFLAMIVLLALFTLFDRHGDLYNYQQALMRASGSNRTAFNEINKYVLQSYRVLASQEVNSTFYASDINTMVLQIPAVNNSGDIIANTYDYAVFDLDGAELKQIVQANAASSRLSLDRQLSDNVTSLVFSYDSLDFSAVKKVTVDIATSSASGRQNASSELAQQILLRNY